MKTLNKIAQALVNVLCFVLLLIAKLLMLVFGPPLLLVIMVVGVGAILLYGLWECAVNPFAKERESDEFRTSSQRCRNDHRPLYGS